MKKICFIIESMGGGGTQKNLYRLINTFEKDETKVSLITFKKKKRTLFSKQKLSVIMQMFLYIQVI